MNFDKQYILGITEELLTTDSPSGFTAAVMEKLRGYARALGYKFETTPKGTGIITVEGMSGKTIGLCAHVDTLGLMVRSIKPNGTLAITSVGVPLLPTLDGEYCRVYTRDGRVYTGTVLSNSPSGHVYKDAKELDRDEKNMHVRLDNVVKTRKDTQALGITPGDYICYDTKTVITDTGFIKSRFLDDKLSVGLIFGVLKHLRDTGRRPEHTVKVIFSIYEEVGHGMAYIPEGMRELLAVDMGCIGEDLSCTEQDVSICAKDSGGPYDYELTNRLIRLAKENGVKYAVDIYPSYTSDISAAWRGGNDVRGALIGPGVHASHGMERSHYDAVLNTMRLILLYLTEGSPAKA